MKERRICSRVNVRQEKGVKVMCRVFLAVILSVSMVVSPAGWGVMEAFA